jgi:capsid portal protein
MTRKRRRNRALEARQAEQLSGPLTKSHILAKAEALTNSVDEPTARQALDDRETTFAEQGAVIPDYDPEALLNFVELSPHLAPNIAAYVQNIEGYGHQQGLAEPWMSDLESEEAYEAVRQALIIEAWADAEDEALAVDEERNELKAALGSVRQKHAEALSKGRTPATISKWRKAVDEAQDALDEFEEGQEPGDADAADENDVSDDVVEAKLKELDMQIRREQFLFDAFFKNCVSVMSFGKLRRVVRQDIESSGWGCMEMERDGYGRLKRLSYVPGYTVRPVRQRSEVIEVIEDDSVTPLSEGREITVKRRFSTFVQIVDGEKVYFKTPKDPRIISRTTGKAYDSLADMRKPKDKGGEGKEAEPANDLIWIAQHSPKTAAAPPRWIGNLLQVLGGREADETNYFYLRDNAIPYGLLFVTGGNIPTDIKERLEHRLTAEVRGSEGSGKILVVQAKPMGKASSDGRTVLPEMTFQSLREAVQNDALFTKYDERGGDRIGASFRLSPILRGYTPSNLNRATAIAAIMLAETQVFQPEREDMDWIFNKYILPELGIRYVTFVSNSPPTRSVDDAVEIINAAAPHGGLLPNEIRMMLADLMNKPLAKIQEDWANTPMVMTLAGLDGTGTEAVTEEGEGMDGELADLGRRTAETDLGKRLANIEARIRHIVAAELQTAGIDMDVGAAFVGSGG